MTEEREYLQAFDLARKAKKRYLKKALEKEEKEHLISIGLDAEILEGGKLHTKVYNNLGKWRDHKGLFDENICIPSMDRVYDEVKRIHPRIGHFRCIGWDFTIDVNGEPVMIEYNVFPMLGNPQLVRCKPVFNEQTDWILEDYYEHRTWANNHPQDILIQ